MQRRRFLTFCGTSIAMAGLDKDVASGTERGPKQPQNAKMHLGCQRGPTTAEMLDYWKRHAVDAICGYPSFSAERGYWTLEDLRKTQDLCEKHGIALEMVAMPLPGSGHIDREKHGGIMLAQEPERSRDIERIQRMIEACSQAGIPAFKYNLTLLSVLRTGTSPGAAGLAV